VRKAQEVERFRFPVSGFRSPPLCRSSIAYGPNSSSRVFSGCSPL
jgi:hypothetical protein